MAKRLEKMRELEEKLKPVLEKKEYWKAKQILRSRIKNSDHYNPELFGLYGKVLAKMHDDMEAGKYFFLSNLRGTGYDDKIRLFLARYANTKNKRCISLTCQFPKIARYRKIEDFPEPTRSDIIKLGLKPDASLETGASLEKVKSNIFDALIFILIIMVLVSIPVGIVTIWKWIIKAIF